MFFRKLLGNNDPKQDQKAGPPAGMQTMGASLQKRFSKGIQYNMKIIIKGDRNVGKTCLFQRLQGQKFKEEYIPTEEIQVTSIMWNYKATDDIVKVEVWDVVDKGKKKKKIDGLKLDTATDGPSDIWSQDGTPPLIKSPVLPSSSKPGKQKSPLPCPDIERVYEDPCLDAEFIDVYKGTQGVILMMDITKQWTFDYIQRELPKVPNHIPVLLLANHRDMGHHRTTTEDQLHMLIEEQARPEDSAQIRYAESSMRNGFGLKYIHKFFNLPFLQLQRQTLLKQLKTNQQEIETTNQELALHEESEDQNYDLFLDSLTCKRREQQEKLASSALSDAKKKQDEEKAQAEAAAAMAAAAAVTRSQNGPKSAPSTPVVPPSTGAIREAPPAKPIPGLDLKAPVKARPSTEDTGASKNTSKSAPPTPTAAPPPPEQKASLMSRLFGSKKSKLPESAEQVPAASSPTSPEPPLPSVKSVDDFAPNEALDASFLDDTEGVKLDQGGGLDQQSSSEDDINPLVACDQDDLDEDDLGDIPAKPSIYSSGANVHNIFSADLELSSEEESLTQPVISRDVDSDSEPETEVSKPKTLPSKRPQLLANGTNHLSHGKSQSIKDQALSPGTDFMELDSGIAKEQSKISSKLSTSIARSKSSDEQSCGREVSSEDDQHTTQSTLKYNKKEKQTRKDSDEDTDEEDNIHIAVLQDVEDLSDEETTTSSKPADSGLATDTTAENDGSSTSETKQSLGLEFEDLSVLEKGFDFNTGLLREQSVSCDVSTEGSVKTMEDSDVASTGKKKKHRSKDKEREKDPDRSHKKKKKHKEREQEDDNKEKKKKKKSRKHDTEGLSKEEQDLEAFLGGPGPGDGNYESL